MQRTKEAAQEHVRWRSVQIDEADPAVAAVASAMRASARAYEQSDPGRDLRLLRGTGEPGSASLAQADFLEKAHKRSLAVLKLRKDEALRDEYRTLLKALPAITLEKVGKEQLATPDGRARAIGMLVAKHGGEIVELDRRRARWSLERVVPDAVSARHSEQWYCCPGGVTVDKTDLDFGWPGTSLDFMVQVDVAIRRARNEGCRTSPHDLQPHWAKHVSRVTCPCLDIACGHEWVRDGKVMTLGELFLALGKQKTGAEI